jgi:2-C-methyl-D-erythritol 4-phosphate cytidylyltransferase
MIVAAILVAAGRGRRLGASQPKALVPIGGRPLIARALAAFATHPRIGPLVVVVSEPEAVRAAIAGVAARAQVVAGGAERQDSVRLGLAAIDRADLVLVHDAARPLVPRPVIDAVIAAAARHGAALPAIAPPDTVKEVDGEGTIMATLPRERLRLAQTPQGFRFDLLRTAHARAESDRFRGTDDAALVERTGARVVTVEGSPRNFKITRPEDLALAEALVRLEEDRHAGSHE